MKLNFTIALGFFGLLLASSPKSQAQGWMSNGPSLFTQNAPSQSVLNVGIGTSTPTAQLHTNGTVRFQGLSINDSLNRILVSDTSGNLFYRDASSLVTGGGWSLTGNSGTNPSANFLGTTDNNRLVFRTGNVERMTILPGGYTGIGTSSPTRLLSIQGNNVNDNAELHIRQLSGTNLGAYVTMDNSANGGQSWSIGSTGSLNTPQVVGALEFYQYPSRTRMIIDSTGKVGIAVHKPTAVLHTVGTVRFQDLPSGTGNILVIDGNGNIFASSQAVTTTQPNDTALAQQVNNLTNIIMSQQQMIESIQDQLNGMKIQSADFSKPSLKQNVPNPTTGQTQIAYYIPSFSKNASIQLFDLQGRTVKQIMINNTGSGTATISGQELLKGMYYYSLVIDGKIAETKRMVIQ